MQTGRKFDHGRAAGGYGVACVAELQQGVRLFDSSGIYAAWAVDLEAARDGADAIGEQSGGQRVAGAAGEGLLVEAKGQRLAAIDGAAAGDSVGSYVVIHARK